VSIAPNASMRIVFTLICLGGLATAASVLVPTTASADRLQPCAREGGTCRLRYPAEVVFGAQGRTTSRFFDRDAVPCTTRVFGDPAPGRVKTCYIVLRDRGESDDSYDQPDEPLRDRWSACAGEGDFCDFRGRKVVRYGTRGRFTEDVFRTGVQCDNETFGDPAPGAQKRCYIRQ